MNIYLYLIISSYNRLVHAIYSGHQTPHMTFHHDFWLAEVPECDLLLCLLSLQTLYNQMGMCELSLNTYIHPQLQYINITIRKSKLYNYINRKPSEINYLCFSLIFCHSHILHHMCRCFLLIHSEKAISTANINNEIKFAPILTAFPLSLISVCKSFISTLSTHGDIAHPCFICPCRPILLSLY